ncbi:MAG TPA: rhodanese-related sulfurtransferase [Candidatus Saccharimonadales bacterium]|nr:rhodanese-related sulfurtransferase [Candidatus Saccharimonadales bacterium]
MQKILLYYKFTPLSDPEAVRLWQRTLCESLNLKGRILISQHGLNGTVGGDIEDLKKYVKATKTYAPMKGIVFKWSEGAREDFPKLSVRVRPEIVTFGVPEEIKVDDRGVVGGGKHLSPEAVHQLVQERGDEVVFFDGRNAYEAKVGKFKDAVVPETRTTRDFLNELAGDKYAKIKDKPVVTYCTGGVRCEVLSALMKNRGFKEVYQIDGGIVKYGQKFGDDGLWQGKLYVFDRRLVVPFTEKAKDIGHCIHCDAKTSNFVNCANAACNNLVLICKECVQQTTTCSVECAKKIADNPSLVLDTNPA